MQSKFSLSSLFFSLCSLCLQNDSKSGSLLSAGRPICFTLVSLSLSPSLLSLVPNTHKRAHAHTTRRTQNGRTPLVLRRRLLLKADEMKEQLASLALL